MNKIEVEKPAVLVDIDDTIADTMVHMLEFINNLAPEPYVYDQLDRASREDNHGPFKRLVQRYLRQPDLVVEAPPVVDAMTGFLKLHEAGVPIHVASARKSGLHEASEEWLERNGFHEYVSAVHRRPDEIAGTEFKPRVAEAVRAVAAFDDTHNVALSLAEHGVEVYLIDKPWNADDDLPENVYRVGSFTEAVELFLERHPELGQVA